MGGYWAYQWIALHSAGRDFRRWLRANLPFSIFATLTAVIALTAAATFAPKPFAGVNVFQEVMVALCEGIGGTFFLAFLVFVWFWMRASHKLYWESQRKIDGFQKRLKPKLKLSFPEQHGIEQVNRGHPQEMFSGRRQAVFTTTPEIILRVLCTNESSARIGDCRAWLVGVKAVTEDGTLTDVGFSDAVELSWSRDLSAHEFVADLQPNLPRGIFVVARRSGAAFIIWRASDEIPIEYAILFKNDQTYRIWIQVNGPDDVGDSMCLDIWPLGGPTIPPLPSIGVRVVDEPAKSAIPSLQAPQNTGLETSH